VRALLLVCADPDERQFAGLRRLLPRLEAGIPGLAWRQWRGRALSFRRHRRLGPVLISGHGAADRAAFRSPFGCLTPALLRLPRGASLYLLGCHQGRAELRRAWAAGTGTAEERVRGQAGETESAFSTCLLLHLLEDGLPGLDGWFAAWQRCNAELAGHLPLLRDAYARCGADPLRAWEQLRCLPALQAHRSFLGAGLRHPEYLSGLA
jgi:hypothetical protein